MTKYKQDLYKSLNEINNRLRNKNRKQISFRTYKKVCNRYKRDLRKVKILYGNSIYLEALNNHHFAKTVINYMRNKRGLNDLKPRRETKGVK